MLRKIRITLAIICFISITELFLDFTGSFYHWFGWFAKIQFLPALLAMNFSIVIGLILLTLVLGRIYCSVICPLGVFQDIISWIAGKRKKNRLSYSPAQSWLRYGVLVLFIIALTAGISSVVSLLAPYSSYGRIVSNLFSPLYLWGNNIIAVISEKMDSYMFYTVEIWMKSIVTFIITIGTFAILSFLAWKNGRTYCNSICPVGTALGFLAKFSLLKPVIDKSKCNGCSLCSRNCKSSCIDSKTHQIDYSRCVACMDCIDKCRRKAIKYTTKQKLYYNNEERELDGLKAAKETNTARRSFLSVTTMFAFSTVMNAQNKKVDGGLAIITDKKPPVRNSPLAPAGSLSIQNFRQHCTACQLCISVCPNEVLKPSENLVNLMQPEMSYERGYCRPECTKCSEVCPTGAIHPINNEDKSAIQIGHAVWIKKNCVVITDNVSCRNCARHCPTGAIYMAPCNPNDLKSLKIPVIDTERCIGCGACENLCPSRPFSAIYVEGHERHRTV